MTAGIRIREYTRMMTNARRISRKNEDTIVVLEKKLFLQLLNTLDELTGIDTSEPNKVRVRMSNG